MVPPYVRSLMQNKISRCTLNTFFDKLTTFLKYFYGNMQLLKNNEKTIAMHYLKAVWLDDFVRLPMVSR